jgi:hypothetical protein
MTHFNTQGFAVREKSGQMLTESYTSALSHKRLAPGGALVPVSGTDGLFICLLPAEAKALSKKDQKALEQQAFDWFASFQVRQAEKQVKPDPQLPNVDENDDEGGAS